MTDAALPWVRAENQRSPEQAPYILPLCGVESFLVPSGAACTFRRGDNPTPLQAHLAFPTSVWSRARGGLHSETRPGAARTVPSLCLCRSVNLPWASVGLGRLPLSLQRIAGTFSLRSRSNLAYPQLHSSHACQHAVRQGHLQRSSPLRPSTETRIHWLVDLSRYG